MVKRIGQDLQVGKIYFAEWRAYRDLSQEDVAERLNCGKSAISKLENGETKYNQSSLEALAQAFGVEPHEMLRPPPPPHRPTETDVIKLFEKATPETRKIIETILSTGTKR